LRPELLRGDRLGEHGGLSELGRKLVTHLNELGVVIDVSQLSPAAVAQAWRSRGGRHRREPAAERDSFAYLNASTKRPRP
jgi:hypothetical protein